MGPANCKSDFFFKKNCDASTKDYVLGFESQWMDMYRMMMPVASAEKMMDHHVAFRRR
jgi:hypothetical protein